MIEISEIKSRARGSLEGRLFGNVWMALVLCNVLYALIVGLPSSFSTFSHYLPTAVTASVTVPLLFCGMLLGGPMAYGFARVYHKLAKGGKRVEIGDLFSGFRDYLGDTFVLGLMRSLYIFLWSLLLIVPGIVKAYSYSMAFYIQQDSEDKNWRNCLDESKELIYGYRGKLFLMDLSFIGWYIVGALCFGVGVFWVEAYHAAARAHFYEELKKIKKGDAGEPDGEERDDFAAPTEEDDRDVFDFGARNAERPSNDDRDVFDYGGSDSDETDREE